MKITKKIIQKIHYGCLFLFTGIAVLLNGCSDDFLDPDPLSFYEPGATFTTESGLMAAMAISDRHLKLYYAHDHNEMFPIGTEYIFSDLGLPAATDKTGMLDNVAALMTPTSLSTSNLNDLGKVNSIWYFWKETYTGILNANTILTYVDGVQGLSEETKNAYKGRAYCMLTELVLLDESELVHLPGHLSFEEGATLPCAGVTAWYALFGDMPLIPGEDVLVQGTGGVSIFALQFAKISGARVIATTTSPAKMETLRTLGADVVIDTSQGAGWHKKVLDATNGRGVDVAVDVVGPSNWDDTVGATRENGRISMVGALHDTMGNNSQKGYNISLKFMIRGLHLHQTRVGSRLHFEQMNRAMEHHGIHPVIDRVFDFDETAAAFEYFEHGKRVGKVVIRHNL
jgi:NADPH:quinone reductase-like Zn-dependent oxidoreductase